MCGWSRDPRCEFSSVRCHARNENNSSCPAGPLLPARQQYFNSKDGMDSLTCACSVSPSLLFISFHFPGWWDAYWKISRYICVVRALFVVYRIHFFEFVFFSLTVCSFLIEAYQDFFHHCVAGFSRDQLVLVLLMIHIRHLRAQVQPICTLAVYVDREQQICAAIWGEEFFQLSDDFCELFSWNSIRTFGGGGF